MADEQLEIIVATDEEGLVITGPDAAVDAVATALAADKAALELVVDVFRPVEVVAAGEPSRWPPRGGFVPAWRRLSSARPFIVLPSETVAGRIDPYAAEMPAAPCSSCTMRTGAVPAGPIFETGPWQSCSRCRGRRWCSSADGDVCVTCGPAPGRDAVPATWVRTSGWVCGRCHPQPPTDTRPICAICGGKGTCRPDHVAQLRRLGAQLLRRTRSAAKRERLRSALAALPEESAAALEVSRQSRAVQGWRPPRTTTTRLGKEVTWATTQPDSDGEADG